jgi:drug/metabolite transporter (DMT)-like permease
MDWYYLVLLSSVLMGLENLISKRTLRKEHATEFSAALAPIVAVLSLLFIGYADFNITAWQLLLIMLISALNAYTFLLMARVFRHGEISIASPTFSSLPTFFGVILAFFFLGEHLDALQYASVVGMVVATFLLFRVPKKSGKKQHIFDHNDKKYKFMMMLNVILSSVGILIGKFALVQINPFTFLILSGWFMAIFFSIFITVKYSGVPEIIKAVKKYPLPLFSNAILTVGYRVTYYVALVAAPVSMAQPLRNMLYLIITVVLGCLLFKEEGLKRKLALGLAMLVFAYLLTI